MNEYQPSTILPPGQGTSKFGGTQSRIIMGGVNCQKLGANMLPGLLIAGEQYGIVTDGITVARNASANPDVIEIQNAWSLMSDEAVLNSAVAVVDYDPETLAYDAESGVLTGVTTVAFEAGTAYWCKEIVAIGEVQLYVYEPTVAGRDVREVYEAVQPVTVAAEAYNVGKVQLAQAITSKGVETSPTETYPEMAEKVAQIAQTETVINGGEMYAAQQFGDGALWNLYEVLAQMKTRFMGTGDYAALIVCEYYKGYPSLALQGADGYYTCDGDYYDYASPNHVWHDDVNGKMNRWVAFLYREEGARLDITNTSISPLSMYIGGHIGTIEYFVNGRLTDLVCGIEETDVLDNFAQKGYTQIFSQSVILRNVKSYRQLVSGNVVNFIMENTDIVPSSYETEHLNIGAQYIYINHSNNLAFGNTYQHIMWCPNAIVVIIDGATISTSDYSKVFWNSMQNIKLIHLYGFLGGYLWGYGEAGILTAQLEDVLVGEAIYRINIKEWNPMAVLADADAKTRLINNIKNHILARVSDRTGLSQLVFTVSTNMYNNIASEQIEWQGETMSLADAFLTKNWLLAGA